MRTSPRQLLDGIATLLVIVAASFVIWTQIEARWLRPSRPSAVANVPPTTIAKTHILRERGAGDVVLVEFTDYECPFCAQHARSTGQIIEDEMIASGQLRHILFNFPLERVHPHARMAAESVHCAGRQGMEWEMHRRLFDETALSAAAFHRLAATVPGLDAVAFNDCLDGDVTDAVTSEVNFGRELGVSSTPTFFLGRRNPDGSVVVTRRFIGVLPIDQFREELRTFSAQQSS